MGESHVHSRVKGWAAALPMVVLAGSGCGSSDSGVLAPSFTNRMPHPTPVEFRSAPSRLVVNGRIVSVEAELWRDFMPISPPEGSPLAAVVYLSAPAGEPPAAGELYIWAIRGNEIWRSVMTFSYVDGTRSNARVYQSGGGPRWEPGTTVDVVIGLRTSWSEVALVRIPGVPIRASS